MENKKIVICRHCGSTVDIEECKTEKYWTNDGDHVLYHICPECNNSIEETKL